MLDPIIIDDKTQTFNGKRYRLHKGQRYFWRHRRIDGVLKAFLLHREVWEAANGQIPEKHHIHHVNGIKADNRLENLQCLPESDHCKISWAVALSTITKKKVMTCAQCGETYEGVARSIFCSDRCKGANRMTKSHYQEYLKQYRASGKARAAALRWYHRNKAKQEAAHG